MSISENKEAGKVMGSSMGSAYIIIGNRNRSKLLIKFANYNVFGNKAMEGKVWNHLGYIDKNSLLNWAKEQGLKFKEIFPI